MVHPILVALSLQVHAQADQGYHEEGQDDAAQDEEDGVLLDECREVIVYICVFVWSVGPCAHIVCLFGGIVAGLWVVVRGAYRVFRVSLAHAEAQVFNVCICFKFGHVEDSIVSREEYRAGIPLAVGVGVRVWEDA